MCFLCRLSSLKCRCFEKPAALCLWHAILETFVKNIAETLVLQGTMDYA